MNTETLKYLTALQPKIREAMGEWQIGYRFLFAGEESIQICATVDDTGIGWYNYLDTYKTVSKKAPSLIRVPLAIDDEHPERGLLGMLKHVSEIYPMEGVWKITIWDDQTYVGDTPTEALLKALAAQEGVEL